MCVRDVILDKTHLSSTLKIADGELLNPTVGSLLYSKDLYYKMKNQRKRQIESSSESSCHLTQSIPAGEPVMRK